MRFGLFELASSLGLEMGSKSSLGTYKTYMDKAKTEIVSEVCYGRCLNTLSNLPEDAESHKQYSN